MENKLVDFKKSPSIICTVSSAVTHIHIPKNPHNVKLLNKNTGFMGEMGTLVSHYSKLC